jgi:catechol 2,3-dioxygenase-like lactoylglutathione lyase family enzyme
MQIEKIDHIRIAVKDLEEALKLYTDIFGLEIKKLKNSEI